MFKFLANTYKFTTLLFLTIIIFSCSRDEIGVEDLYNVSDTDIIESRRSNNKYEGFWTCDIRSRNQ